MSIENAQEAQRCPKCGGGHYVNFCAECGHPRPAAAPETSEREKGADRLRCAWYGDGMHQGIAWSACDPLDKEDWLSVYDEAVKMASEKPAPSADPASAEELATVMSDYALELHAAGRDWEWDDMAAAAIAHCGQDAESARRLRSEWQELNDQSNANLDRAVEAERERDEQRQRADAKLREWGMACAEAVDLRAEVKQLKDKLAEKTECFYAADEKNDAQAAEIARLKEEVEAWKDVAAACTASQPAPEGLSALLSAINDHLRHGSCSADGYLSEAMRDAELRVAQPQAQEGKKK
jgi:ribosomal protein L37E